MSLWRHLFAATERHMFSRRAASLYSLEHAIVCSPAPGGFTYHGIRIKSHKTNCRHCIRHQVTLNKPNCQHCTCHGVGVVRFFPHEIRIKSRKTNCQHCTVKYNLVHCPRSCAAAKIFMRAYQLQAQAPTWLIATP